MAKLIYYPELNEQKPNAQIDALISYCKHIGIETNLELKGQGINFYSTYNSINKYYVTQKAFDKLAKKYDIAVKIYLD